MPLVIPARRARPRLMIGPSSNDYYASLAEYMLSFSYNDNLGKADDLQLKLADPESRFINDSFPLKGAQVIDAAIICTNLGMDFPPQITLDCGTFEIDDISYAEPPNVILVKANSIPCTSTIKSSKKIRAWESKDLNAIATDIAGENSMTVRYDTQENPRFKRIEQNDVSDLKFLQKQADAAGLKMKIKRREIIIFDEKSYEEKAPSFTLTRGEGWIINVGFRTKLADTAKKSKVSYTDPETGKVTRAEFSDPDPDFLYTGELADYDNPHGEPDESDPDPDPFAPTLYADVPPLIDYDTTQNAPSKNRGKGAGLQKKSEKKAKGNLRKANRHRDTAQFLLHGMPLCASGQTCLLAGYGKWDGKYLIEGAAHSIEGKKSFTTKLQMHRELASKGY